MATQLIVGDEVVGRSSIRQSLPAASGRPTLAAAAEPVLPLVTGSPLQGTVLGSFGEAVTIGVATPGAHRVVSLLSPRAAGVPNGVRLTDRQTSFVRIAPGDRATVGGGWVRIGDLSVRVVRSWSCRVHRIRPSAAAVRELDRIVESVDCGAPAPAVTALRRALNDDQKELNGSVGRAPAETAYPGPCAGSTFDMDAIAAAVTALVGAGSGLTPGGDDVLAGLMTALHACGRMALADRIGALALRRVTDRTTLLSADLLRLAADGHACLEALAVVGAISDPGGPAAPLVDRLLSLGHTSGADLATGLLIGLRLVLPRPAARRVGQEAR